MSDRQFRSLDPLVGAILTPGYLKYAKVGSEEESGKDWDELEEEARKGNFKICCFG